MIDICLTLWRDNEITGFTPIYPYLSSNEECWYHLVSQIFLEVKVFSLYSHMLPMISVHLKVFYKLQGQVLYLLRKEGDAEALIQDSIRILEVNKLLLKWLVILFTCFWFNNIGIPIFFYSYQEGGQGESIMCVRRLRYLAQVCC